MLAMERQPAGAPFHERSIIGESRGMRRVRSLIEQVGPSDTTVLITGESGTGKELVARSLHEHSQRASGPMVALNCAAMPPTLLESELFGHEKGAFTDAVNTRPGLFLRADGGTLFLDEIGEMPDEMQAKLLRVLEERRVRQVGSDTDIAFDARIISATNRDLKQEVEAGRFREDLYFRINVINIEVPPLRERGTDVLLLAHRFLAGLQPTGNAVTDIAPEAESHLLRYSWPGNVRELQNCIERAVTLATSSTIGPDGLPEEIREGRSQVRLNDSTDIADLLPTLEEVERAHIERVLDVVGGNKSHAARVLGVSRRTLYRRLERLAIDTST